MQTRLPLLLLVLSSFSFSIFAQNDTLPPDFVVKGMAIGISAPELIDQMMVVMPGLGSHAKDMLTEQSVKPYLMPPRKPHTQWYSASYTLASCMEFYTNFETNYKVNLSPDFVRLSLEQSGNFDVKNALRFLVTDGTVSADIMPYDAPQIPRSAGATEKYKIENYLQIFRKESRNGQKVFETQKALLRGNPVIVEMNVPEGFEDIKGTRFWTSIGTPGERVIPFLVVGYNLELEAFEILGSWGPEWASNGYLWVDFDDFAGMVENGFVMVP
ncbi:MAG: hypothetical protein EPO28_12795 [Saprospiraceae bacterium]|nr:MAG: hypothetical protein EPO28_12795 [Saprospiraceae bacterium]